MWEKADNITFEQIFLQKFLYKEHRHQQNHCYISVILEKLIKPCDSFQNAFLSYRLHCLLLSIVKASKSRVYSKEKLYKSKEPVTIMVTQLMIRMHAKIILKRVWLIYFDSQNPTGAPNTPMIETKIYKYLSSSVNQFLLGYEAGGDLTM